MPSLRQLFLNAKRVVIRFWFDETLDDGSTIDKPIDVIRIKVNQRRALYMKFLKYLSDLINHLNP